MSTMRSCTIVLAVLALGACASGPSGTTGPRPSVATVPSIEAEVPAKVSLRAARETGLASVIGQRADALLERFGQTRIDLAEGNARKLQFAGERCVLDIYFYPIASGLESVATHIEARLRDGGADTDRMECVREIESR